MNENNLNPVKPIMPEALNQNPQNQNINATQNLNTQSPITPITPIPMNNQTPPNQVPTNMTNPNLVSQPIISPQPNTTPISSIPTNIVQSQSPYIQNQTTNNQQFVNTNAVSSQPQTLQLDGSSPFDIGIGLDNTTIMPQSSPQGNVPFSPNQTIPHNSTPNLTSNINPPQPTPAEEPLVTPVPNKNNIVKPQTYLIHMILFSIPIIGFIILIKKAFTKTNPNIRSFAIAQLLYSLILIIIVALVSIVMSKNLINITENNNIAPNSSNYPTFYNFEN